MLRILLHRGLEEQHSVGQVSLLKATQPFLKRLRVVTQGILLLKLVALEGRKVRGDSEERIRQPGQQGWENSEQDRCRR